MANTTTSSSGALLIVAASVAASIATTSFTSRPAPSASATTTVIRPTPNVLRSVQELARLESVTFHMERVIDLHDEQEHAFGLVHADDSILLVAVGEVIAGVDLAALLGALPLALGTGTGAELRRPLGIAIVGGLLVSQMLTLFTTPVIYLALDRFTRRKARPEA